MSQRITPLRCLFLTLTFLAIDAGAPAGEPTIAELERQFRELPMEARRLTGPLFWLHGDEPPELLEDYVASRPPNVTG